MYIKESNMTANIDLDCNDAFELLENALKKTPLRQSDGKYRKAQSDEFYFMNVTPDNWVAFKHFNTRNYLFVDLESGRVHVPSEDTPFLRGYFEIVDVI
jgi:hypothetical protein